MINADLGDDKSRFAIANSARTDLDSGSFHGVSKKILMSKKQAIEQPKLIAQNILNTTIENPIIISLCGGVSILQSRGMLRCHLVLSLYSELLLRLRASHRQDRR